MKRLFLIVILMTPVALRAQTPTAVPVSAEPHHHLVLENSYVRVYYVDVAPHASTLEHRHDLPYFAVLLSGGTAPSGPSTEATSQTADAARTLYSPGHISHTVPNPADVSFRNVTVELLHPQGTVRNRCMELVPNQPREQCDLEASEKLRPPIHYAVFETSEILVEYWKLDAGVTTKPWDDGYDTLIADLESASVTERSGNGTLNPAPGGVLWVPTGSKPVFKTAADHGGHFFAITFKDSAAPAQR